MRYVASCEANQKKREVVDRSPAKINWMLLIQSMIVTRESFTFFWPNKKHFIKIEVLQEQAKKVQKSYPKSTSIAFTTNMLELYFNM